MMKYEAEVSRAILRAYHDEVSDRLESDAVVAGAGPSGLVCAWRLAQEGRRVLILEKRLAPGGGVWGGGIGMGEVVVEEETGPLLEEIGVRRRPAGEGLLLCNAAELACSLVLRALQSGAVLLNLLYLEDLVVRGGRVRGVVANRTFLGEQLPIDPITFLTGAVVDATGHEAVAARVMAKRGLLEGGAGRVAGEGPMDARAAETFVVERTGPCFPGLYLTGMSVCAVLGGPRMGPIFGGMLRSGERAAKQVLADLG
jgi:thiamine thiazole synthase